MVLHNGKIAEMRTGEGKTLVATLPIYLNALEGKGVHLVTVNDYLAKRDAAWMGKIYNFLGMSVGVVYPGMDHGDKRAAYAADITYGTNNEFGFDYLRDNMALSQGAALPARPQLRDRRRGRLDPDRRGAHAADHLGSVRRIAAALRQGQPHRAAHDAAGKGNRARRAAGARRLLRRRKAEAGAPVRRGHGARRAAAARGRHHRRGRRPLRFAAHLRSCITSTRRCARNAIYQRDVDYIVRDGEIIIVDEFTGRTLPGRRWSDGLHQAVEAKEGVPIQRENQTLASITFQNLFRMYKKLAGMTGTADTEAYEFQQIYGLEVVVIPTHRPMVRKDEADVVFLKQQAEVRRDRRRHQGMLRPRPAGAGRHRVDRDVRAALGPAQEAARSARSAERKAARARSAHRRAGGPSEGDHDRDQHGRPRHRHRARRQPRSRAAMRLPKTRQRRRARAHQDRMEEAPRGSRRLRRPAHRRHRAPRIAAHRQPAARPFGPPGRSGFEPFLPLARRQPDPHLHGRGRRAPDAHVRHEGRRCDPGSHGQPPDREGAAQGRSAQLRHPQAPARVRRHRERSAQGHLPAAQRAARQRERRRDDRRRAPATSSTSWCAASCRPNRSTSSGISPGSSASSIPSSASSSISSSGSKARPRRIRRTCASTCRKTSSACSARRKRWSAPKSCARSKST